MRANVSREVIGLGIALGLGLALAEPVGRLVAGAPAWAPADMHRASTAAAGPRYQAHSVPYGIDRGICDRRLRSADLKRTGIALVVGDAIGARMDIVDHACIGSALEFAPDQNRVMWRNGDTAVSYAVVASRTYQNGRGAYCREFDTSAVTGSDLRQVHGLACRQPDGTWLAVR